MTAVQAKLFQTGYSGLTYTDIANYLGKTLSAAEQTLATSLIAACEAFFCRQCNRQFKIVDGQVAQEYYDELDGGRYEYILRNSPIADIKKLVVDGTTYYDATAESNIYDKGSDFTFTDDTLILLTFTPEGTNSNSQIFKVYYTLQSFWADDLKLAIKMWVGELMLSREYAGKAVTNISSSGIGLAFNPASQPEYIKTILSTYKQFSF